VKRRGGEERKKRRGEVQRRGEVKKRGEEETILGEDPN
jgi:hypothetical protein